MGSHEVRSPATPAQRGLPSIVVAMLFRSAGVLALLAVPAISGPSSVGTGAAGDRPERQQAADWKGTYSLRYPGCVPSVLWPADEHPVALITRRPDGRVDKVALGGGRRPVGSVTDGTRTIGACR
jgi:hypothetical protein